MREINVDFKSVPKTPVLIRPDNSEVQFWDTFLDIVCKLSFGTEIQDAVHLKITSLLLFDWLSLRRLDLSSIRTLLTKRGQWKVSTKPSASVVSNGWFDAVDTVIQAAWVAFIRPLMRLLRSVARKVNTHNHDDKHVFNANLMMLWEWFWALTTQSKKWNSLKSLPKWFCHGAEWLHKPGLLMQSDIDIKQWFTTGDLHVRHNVPIFNLGRDHAKEIQVRIAYICKIVMKWSWNVIMCHENESIPLWKITYKGIADS